MIINEDKTQPKVINLLKNTSSPTVKQTHLFAFAKYETSNKCLNLFECTEGMCEHFLTERTLVVVTFEVVQPEKTIAQSIVRRLLKIANKNILPASILILGLSKLEENLFNKIVENVNEALDTLKHELQTSVDESLK